MYGWMNSPFANAGSVGIALHARPVAPGVRRPSSMKPRTLSNCAQLMMLPMSVFSSSGSPITIASTFAASASTKRSWIVRST